jgi:hypothetical protein
MILVDLAKVENIISNSPAGKNTKFLSAAHSLWYRFHNYDKALPMAYEVNGDVVCLIFATFNRDGYANLYEIVTLEGKEGNGREVRLQGRRTQEAFAACSASRRRAA